MIEPYKSKVQLNLKKAQGQINLLQKMIDDKRYCVDVAQQVNATIGLLKRANDLILEGHLNSCAAHKLNSKKKEERESFVKELIKNFKITS
ncbi:MAG: metal-sensing transcriptional repressor [Candidatus Paceibacterota bacterium]|jgi:DNA-binding FrmR family transcriptional regulator